MDTVRVNLGNNSYTIHIGQGILQDIGAYLSDMGLTKQALVISDDNVGALYGEVVLASLQKAGFGAQLVCVPPGEASKSLSTAEKLYNAVIEAHLDRHSPIVALGGGVIGDLAGFVAATYLRGVPFVQVPTSLLAQVDSSVGGKVAVDHALGKNLIGAFYQPRIVIVDSEVLDTLPEREISAGLAEVIKHGIITDSNFFDFLQENYMQILEKDPVNIEKIILRNCEIKASVVERDEREDNVRMNLNFGHTIGHGVEAEAEYAYRHGEAVSIGMVGAALISFYMGLCSKATVDAVENILTRFNLPTRVRGIAVEALLAFLARDKKKIGNKINWVLLEKIGQVKICQDVPDKIVRQALADLERTV